MNALADNDILIKCSCYCLLDSLVSMVSPTSSIGILGAAKYVVTKSIERKISGERRDSSVNHFLSFVNQSVVVEPTDEELRLASDFELIAQQQALQLDKGESQLCAILITRGVSTLLTGDKRAIIALEKLIDSEARLEHVIGKIRCLEQLVLHLINHSGLESVRTAVCGEPQVDKALTVCLSCSNPDVTQQNVIDGLNSYIEDLRSKASRLFTI